MIHPFKGTKPEIDDSALVVDSAQIIGDVKIGEESSVSEKSTSAVGIKGPKKKTIFPQKSGWPNSLIAMKRDTFQPAVASAKNPKY